MNCHDFRDNWSDWHERWLEAGSAAMGRHRDSCDACQRYDRQMRDMIHALQTLPMPEEQPAGESAPQHRPPRRPSLPVWAAFAATLALGVALGVFLSLPFKDGGGAMVAEPITLAKPGDHRVAVAFDSPRAMENVEFVIELPEGVELQGFPNQRTVSWKGRLAEGRSQLKLPLRVADNVEDTRVVTRVVHGDGERRLEVPLEVNEGTQPDNGDRA